jgi:hypothetical protein
MYMNSSYIHNYAESTKHICKCTIISIIMILLFIISPLNKFTLITVIGRFIIILLLVYTILMNTYLASNFTISFIDGEWNPLKTNVLCSYVFTLFLLGLLIKVIL